MGTVLRDLSRSVKLFREMRFQSVAYRCGGCVLTFERL